MNTTYEVTTCRSSHMTLFGGGFFQQEHTMNFQYIKAAADFSDNLTVYCSVLVLVLVYLLLLLWGRWRDTREAGDLLPMPDNQPGDQALYAVTVLTGSREEASTRSRVRLYLAGEAGGGEVESDIRSCPPGHTFHRGGIDSFLLTTSKHLGPLHRLRIWHDNTGPGALASWELGAVVVRDILTGTTYQFPCHTWLAVEHGDGQVERTLPAWRGEDGVQLSQQWRLRTENSLKQQHLWLAAASRQGAIQISPIQIENLNSSLSRTAGRRGPATPESSG